MIWELWREFKASLLLKISPRQRPNQKWVTDVTKFSLFGDMIYLLPILGLHSSDFTSYVISDRRVLTMVTEMMQKAIPVLPRNFSSIPHSA